ncbi:SAM-dependent methyltransferase [Rossellomorea marisflavi]|uniref:class I SAM-dependent methyltransferase n=1 Tax=Rossellomorea marisflavi TaxID=189381 RepID=UPI0028536E2C|nr:SAM-dependent methyltransferase [Rossellomorea marisflavi]MDR4937999.1 SAM-dependent methyltransferase [Rossellomorea marisflavi]
MEELKVVIGAGPYHNNPDWIHTDELELDLLIEETWKRTYEVSSISAILAEHVWEHLTAEEGLEAAKRCYRYLRKGGYVRCAVPDGFFPDEEYQHIVQVGGPGRADHAAASHKIVHTYKSLTEMFSQAGFEVKLLEYCDEDGQFHASEWDEAKGVIFRSQKVDPRNREVLTFPSLMVDAVKN